MVLLPNDGRPTLALVRSPCRATPVPQRKRVDEALADCVSFVRDLEDLLAGVKHKMAGALPTDGANIASILKRIENERSAVEALFASGRLAVSLVRPLLRPLYKKLSALYGAHPSGHWFDGTAQSVELRLKRLVRIAAGIGLDLEGAAYFHAATRHPRSRTNRRRARLCLV